VAASEEPLAVSDALCAFPGVVEVLSRGETKTTVRLESGLNVDLRVVPPRDFFTLLHHLTGSKAHHQKLRGLAREKGFTLSEWGLTRLPSGERAGAAPEGPPDSTDKVEISSEEALYRTLGLAFVPPELREDQGEIEAAQDGTLPEDLVELGDVRGMVHCHTTWSDGKASVEEMARAALSMGASYLTITDHSQSAAYARGLTRDQLLRQWDEIDRVQERVPIRLLKGTEADILEDGALDWPDEVLEKLELVLVSVHSRMRMTEDEMTRRLTRALSLPIFKIWGHGLGRLLLERDGYLCRVEEVLDALSASRGAVEVNGDPRRLDLEPRHIRAARARKIPLVLSVDAHSVAALSYLRFATVTARRGWARRGEVLNTLGAEDFARAVRPVPNL
jgi:DNA polymerase (family 10)